MEYNITQQKELETVSNLIANASLGTVWRVLRYEPPTPKKTQNQGKGFARGFTTLSDAEVKEKKQAKGGNAKDSKEDYSKEDYSKEYISNEDFSKEGFSKEGCCKEDCYKEDCCKGK